MAVTELRSFSGLPRFVQKVTIDPASVAGATVSVQTFTVTGLTTDMVPVVVLPDIEFADIRPIHARVSATNTLEITFYNYSAATLRDLASQAAYVICL